MAASWLSRKSALQLDMSMASSASAQAVPAPLKKHVMEPPPPKDGAPNGDAVARDMLKPEIINFVSQIQARAGQKTHPADKISSMWRR